ncbi:hypothetical protein Trco_000733 [Trichoderma cornu-damae]|uniref:PXA domain-containing protein n=1 Tax=Trichoderma cornu-damae TaxID=654480 RepID=A0A9P8QWM7_9HYPO|nr:hypothetical protein Trco_000733 [Trichoderma cornu-damae]
MIAATSAPASAPPPPTPPTPPTPPSPPPPLAPARAPTTPRPKNAAAASPPAEAGAAVADRRSSRAAPVDPLSDRATLSLIRRTLCPQHLGDKGRDALPPIHELLPPLTSRNDVDLQLYAFLSIIMREFVQSWYGKITTDETFVPEILRIIAHCSRALEQRARKLDLESLLLDEIPGLLDRHQENEATYRQLLVQAVLAILLPTEDLENPCLTALVEQILSELIIGNVVAGKASQPWLLYEAICIAARSLDEQKARTKARIVSGADKPSLSLPGLGRDADKPQKWTAHGAVVLIIHLGILFFNAVRFVAGTLADSMSVPPRTALHLDEEAADQAQDVKQPPQPPTPPPTDTNLTQAQVPVVTFRLWSCLGNLIELEERKPWLGGFISLLQTAAINGPWRVAGLDGPLDRATPLGVYLVDGSARREGKVPSQQGCDDRRNLQTSLDHTRTEALSIWAASFSSGRPIEAQDTPSRLRLLTIVAPAWATAKRPVHREASITRRPRTGAISYERKRVWTLVG